MRETGVSVRGPSVRVLGGVTSEIEPEANFLLGPILLKGKMTKCLS